MTVEQFSELSDTEQRLQIADDQLERMACPDCGRQRDECADPKRLWYPQREVCYPTMEAAAVNERYDRLHKREPFHDGTFASWSATASSSHPYHYRAGVRVFVAEVDLNPDDDFLSGTPAPDDDYDESEV